MSERTPREWPASGRTRLPNYRSYAAAWLALVCLVGCSAGPGAGESESGAPGQPQLVLPTEGLFGCPIGKACTLLTVSQSLDDRVEVFTLGGDGPRYRGAFSVDFDPNLDGDIGDDALDEPFELVGFGDQFLLSVGHFPQRARGSVLQIPFATFAATAAGQLAPTEQLYGAGAFAEDIVEFPLPSREAIHMSPHHTGRVIVSAFENDLFDAPSTWTVPGSLSLIDPQSGRTATRSLDGFDEETCAGAWKVIPLANGERLAISCAGSPGGVLIIDAASLEQADLDQAIAGLTGCVATINTDTRTVRHLAPAPGGVIIADSPRAADQSSAALWSFDNACQLLGVAQYSGPTLWDFRDLQVHPLHQDRWALLNGIGAQAGVHIVDESGQSCRRIVELDALIPDGQAPLAVRWQGRGTGLVVTTGVAEPLDASGAAGGVFGVSFADADADPCEEPVLEVEDFLAGAPAYDELDPATWRRAGATMHILDYGPQQ